jgi:DNA (cytosine-5)-methyltransferase 1
MARRSRTKPLGQNRHGGVLMNIFELLHEPLKLTQPIRMFEAFSGIGTQAMALKRLGVDYELVGFSEIDKYAIQSYHAIHGDVKNYGDITKMVDIPSCDIFTWSFPCTDLSKAGKRQGMTNDTRSGLVYEVLRLVRDTKDKPKVLIMENVPDLIQATFVRQFGEIQAELESYGYINYVETLNAKDYGIAQNRNRVFMVSILGDYYYEFPKPIPLTTRLKDYLEHDVDEKYFLSDKLLNYMTDMTDRNGFVRGQRFSPHKDLENYAYTITTNSGNRPTDNFIQEPKISYALGSREHEARGWLDLAPTLCARDYKDPKVLLIPEDTKQGYAEARDGDGVYINRPEQKRGVVQEGMIQTIKANNTDIGVVVNDIVQKVSVRKYDVDIQKLQDVLSKHKNMTNKEISNKLGQPVTLVEHWFRKDTSFSIPNADVWYSLKDLLNIKTDEFDVSITTYIEKDNTYDMANRVYDTIGLSPTLTSTDSKSINHNLRIRKLTPRECWRLMGCSDEDFNKAQTVCSNSQLYKQAGNAIVVDTFQAILKNMI